MIELYLITDCCGDSPTDTAYLYVDPYPSPIASADETICAGESAFIYIDNFGPNDTVVWSPTNTLFTTSEDSALVNPTDTTSYSATVYTILTEGGQTRLSCPVTVFIDVNVNATPSVTMSSTDVLCVDDGTATATPTVAGTYDFVWSNGVTDNAVATSTITNLAPGNYCVTVTDVGTGCQTDDCVFVNPAPVLPVVSATNTAITCFGDDNLALMHI